MSAQIRGLSAPSAGKIRFDQWRGAGVSVSAGIPLAGGELKVGSGWFKAKTKELAEGTVKAEGWYTGLGYTYSFDRGR